MISKLWIKRSKHFGANKRSSETIHHIGDYGLKMDVRHAVVVYFRK